MNSNKNCAQEIRQVKVPQLTPTQVTLPPTGIRPRLKFPTARMHDPKTGPKAETWNFNA